MFKQKKWTSNVVPLRQYREWDYLVTQLDDIVQLELCWKSTICQHCMMKHSLIMLFLTHRKKWSEKWDNLKQNITADLFTNLKKQNEAAVKVSFLSGSSVIKEEKTIYQWCFKGVTFHCRRGNVSWKNLCCTISLQMRTAVWVFSRNIHCQLKNKANWFPVIETDHVLLFIKASWPSLRLKNMRTSLRY